jgi:hypothetical protein
MAFHYEVDISQFSAFTNELSRMSGTSQLAVMLHEIERILAECVRLTTRENVDKIKRSVEFKNRTLRPSKSGPAIIYITKKGVIWFADEPGPGNEGIAAGRTSDGKTFHPMSEHFHYSDSRWNRFQGFMSQLEANQIVVRDVIGRAGQSWVQCGHALGLDVEAPAYVKNAPGFKGHSYLNGTGSRGETAKGIFAEIRNESPILLGTLPGHRILQTAVNGRAAAFEIRMRKGVFDDVKERARLYKGIFVR